MLGRMGLWISLCSMKMKRRASEPAVGPPENSTELGTHD